MGCSFYKIIVFFELTAKSQTHEPKDWVLGFAIAQPNLQILSTINYQLSTINYPLSTIHYPLSTAQ